MRGSSIRELKLLTRSLNKNSQSWEETLNFAIEIPFGACDACAEEGHRAIEMAKNSKKYRQVELINRRDREYRYLI